MGVFEISLTNYCNFKCDYCISDFTRGSDKFSKPLLLDESGNLLIHSSKISVEEEKKRNNILITEGPIELKKYVNSEHLKWMSIKDTKHDYGDWIDLNIFEDFIIKKLKNWIITYTGGEPLYYPNIEKHFIKVMETNNITITTNLSLISKLINLKNYDRNKIFFRVGYHPEFRLEHEFLKNINYIRDLGFNYIINYVIHPRHYINSTKYVDYIKLLEDNGLIYEVSPFEGIYENIKYPNNNEIEKSLISKHHLNSIDLSPIGNEYVLTQPTGIIYECQGLSAVIGNIYEYEFNPRTIKKNTCLEKNICFPLKSTKIYDIFFKK